MNSMKRPSKQDVSLSIARLMPSIIRGVQLDFFTHGSITQTQFMVIVAIQSYGRCTMSDLARSMKIKLPTASGIVTRLVTSGLVRRVPDPRDRRRIYIELSAKGVRFFEKFRSVMRSRWEAVLSLVEADELKEFHRIVRKLTARLEAKEKIVS